MEDCELTFTPSGTSANGGRISGLTDQAAGSPNTDTATVTYSPPSGFSGPDTFSYTVTDSANAASSPATVTVIVNPSVRISLRSTSSAANPTAATLDIPTPPGVQLGDVMVAQVDVRGGPTITEPAGWTLIRSDQNLTQMKAAAY